jgi:bifunctional non-homologous end joining protein LigD
MTKGAVSNLAFIEPMKALPVRDLTQQQEFVIGGYTLPERSRKYFGALLVGYYGQGGLLFAGRVGTGFSEKALATLYEGMQKIERATCPLIDLSPF